MTSITMTMRRTPSSWQFQITVWAAVEEQVNIAWHGLAFTQHNTSGQLVWVAQGRLDS